MSEKRKFVPFVSSETNMAEFTVKALIIGLIMSVVLGAANAYLGLKAGMTIAATYPAAVIGMALIKAMKGSILEENFARTVGSIGESVAAGAIFTLPAFFVAGIWPEFYTPGNYFTSTLILISGGILGIMFVALLRRVMTQDAELPFPESVAAAEIHKAGRGGTNGSKFLFGAMAAGAIIKTLADLKFFAYTWEKFIFFSKQAITNTSFFGKGGLLLSSPGISPAYMGVGYIIGPKLGALNFSGGLIAWGLLTPIILYFLGPNIDVDTLATALIANGKATSMDEAINMVWIDSSYSVWKFIVRPIAIGGMLVGAGFTLYKMRNSLFTGISRSINDVKKAASGEAVETERVEKDINFNWIMIGILGVAISTFLITYLIFSTSILVAFVAATVMIILAFFFAAVSGYLVGIMGSSNNPISGLTLTALVVTALIMVLLGVKGNEGVAAVLGVAAIVCVSAAVAGEMLQDLKAGHILGGTPWKMQIGDIIGVIAAGSVMFGVLVILNEGDIKIGGGGFGGKNLAAPQASLMAMLSKGIVAGEMAWPLIIVGMLMGFGLILMQVKSPMLISVGMYLPLETTFAIFIGGLIKGLVDVFNEKKKHNEGQKVRVENVGVLLASGLIAGEALMGLVFAGLAFFDVKLFAIFDKPSFFISTIIVAIIAYILVKIPINNAGNPNDPVPPSAAS
ncbi:MAG: oligopeptide transporter, OPT family [Bacteroidetes bacterium GWE2_29_8]|nr:MAG: oligopeptide transporter, OPT family [Bacteroidetes bacterium GWE2_29_8]OFY24849.1 MAG: oligopeptide transporter, OPT family [Bacteroidetes bacterium GWF2_29_10]